MPFQSWQVVVELLEMGDFRTWRANKKEHDINEALLGPDSRSVAVFEFAASIVGDVPQFIL